MLIRACAFTHMYTHTGGLPRACTRLVLHRRPSYESLDALSRRWISRGTLLQQVHRGAALQSAAGADSAARRPCPRSTVCVCVCVCYATRNRGEAFALPFGKRGGTAIRAILFVVIEAAASSILCARRKGFVISFSNRCKLRMTRRFCCILGVLRMYLINFIEGIFRRSI